MRMLIVTMLQLRECGQRGGGLGGHPGHDGEWLSSGYQDVPLWILVKPCLANGWSQCNVPLARSSTETGQGTVSLGWGQPGPQGWAR